MLSVDTLLLMVLLMAAVLAWRESLRGRERALLECRRICHSYSLQLLDDSVALRRMRLARSASGRRTLQRTYGFEFSRDGSGREQGTVTLLGNRLQTFHLPDRALEAT